MKLSQYLLSGVAILAMPTLAHAQTAAPAPAAKPEAQAADIIVTGTPGGRGVNRLAASFAVTNISSGDLTRSAPKSSAEVLNLVPGVWVESSGGVAGANIAVRGLPSASDAPFVSYQLNGVAIYPAASLSFQENSSIFREDLTISRIEALNGGPGAVFSNAQPGLTVNHVLVEGTDVTKGEVKASFTNYGTKRVDAVISGKLADDLNFAVGGYVTSSKGLRNTQFDSEVGKQFTVNLTKHFDGGKISLYSRYTDDHGAWYLPFAYSVPGINQGTYVQLGNASRLATIQTGATTTQVFDLANGRGWKGTVSGINFEKSFGDGWSVRGHVGYTEGDANTLGLVPDGAAVTAASVALVTGAPLTTNASGAVVPGTAFVQNWGQWVVLKHIKSLIADFSVSKSFAGNDLTLGYYGSNYSSDDYWSLGNFSPYLVQSNGDHIANATCGNLAAAAPSSGSGCWHYDIQDAGTTHVDAIYLGDTFHITEQLKFDVNVREERNHTNFIIYQGSNATTPASQGGTGPNTLLNPYPDQSKPSNVVDDTRDHLSWTSGLDYRISHEMSVYARVSRGYFNPNFDDFRNAGSGNTALSAKLTAFEAGFKYLGHGYFLAVTPFYNEFRGASNGAAFGGVGLTSDDTNIKGVELSGNGKIAAGLSVSGNATWQNSKIVGSTSCGPTAHDTMLATCTIGKIYQRQPKLQLHITPNYEFKTNGATVDLFATYAYVADRFADNGNSVTLPAYAKFDLGATVKVSGIELGAFADNLFNSHGLTEGDPRSTTSANARPIFGRSFKFTVGYKF